MTLQTRLDRLERQQPPITPDDIPLLIVQRGDEKWQPDDDEASAARASAFAQRQPYAVLRPPRVIVYDPTTDPGAKKRAEGRPHDAIYIPANGRETPGKEAAK
jgi:hypothetical protein